MTTFVVHTIDSAPDGSRQPVAHIVERIGFLPNLAATLAGSLAAIESFSQLQASLRGTTLTALEREVVGITVSFVNTSGYSLAAHSTFARRLGAGDELVDALRSGADVPDARLRALQRFTIALLYTRGHAAQEDVETALAAGYTRAQLLEVVTQVAYTTMANLAANLAETPIDEAFAGSRPDRAALTPGRSA